MPPLPADLLHRYTEELKLSAYDAANIIESKPIATYYEALISYTSNYKAAANWMMGEIKSFLNQSATHIDDFPLKPERIAELISLIDSDKVSNSAASQQLFPLMLKSPERSPEAIAEAENLLQKSDDAWLEGLAKEALASFPEKVAAYKAGNKGLLGLFMGEVMKLSDRKANPKMASEIIRKILDQ
jgi:aspartyl-tRNA(Asn)/glutamyl-tRNA(Gln) amidotransferase subunit B